MSSINLLTALESMVGTATNRVSALHDQYQNNEELALPTWNDLRNNETFYNHYRAHVLFQQNVSKELANLSAITVELRRHKLDDLDSVGEGYSITVMKRMRQEMQHYTGLIDDLRTELQTMKSDFDHRLRFFTNSQYLLTSPYNNAQLY